jgi:hypothetical protein
VIDKYGQTETAIAVIENIVVTSLSVTKIQVALKLNGNKT